MQFIGFAANAVCKEQSVTLRPGDSLAGIFEASSGARHGDDIRKVSDKLVPRKTLVTRFSDLVEKNWLR